MAGSGTGGAGAVVVAMVGLKSVGSGETKAVGGWVASGRRPRGGVGGPGWGFFFLMLFFLSNAGRCTVARATGWFGG